MTTRGPNRLKSWQPRVTAVRLLVLLPISLLYTLAAQATDGVAEISETCATQTGCFPGDVPGYPVTINGLAGRSYRLTSDLIIPDENTDGIVLSAPGIGIDLNNFSIVRSGCEDAISRSSCVLVAEGTGSGIVRSGTGGGVSVKNGSITGMGRYGVLLSYQSEVTGLRVRWYRQRGIFVGEASIVSGNTVFENGEDGISTLRASIISGNTVYRNQRAGVSTSFGSVVFGNSVYQNFDDGIQANNGSMVRGNNVRLNLGFGLNLDSDAAYLKNVVTDNQLGTVTGSGSANSRGGNFCAGTGAGSSFCP